MRNGEKRLICVMCLLVSILLAAGCDDGSRRGSGFFVKTEDCTVILGLPPICIDHPGAAVSGSWVSDLSANAVGNTRDFPLTATDQNGSLFIVDGRIPAAWDSGVRWNAPCLNSPTVARFNVTFEDPVIAWACTEFVFGASPSFSLASPPATTLAVYGSGLSSQGGVPRLNLYAPTTGLVSQTLATSVSSDGTTASFPFPRELNGSPLWAGLYGFSLWNQTSPSVFEDVGMGLLSVGSLDASQPTPFGVDGVDYYEAEHYCSVDPSTGYTSCLDWTMQGPYPVVTLSSMNQLSFLGSRVTVGSQPLAVKAYNVQTAVFQLGDGVSDYGTLTITQPTRAVVANSSSNSVSIVDLVNLVTLGSIQVGLQPVALALNNGQTFAYVANYGSGTVSEIDLSSQLLSRVAKIGPRPAALAMDPGATALWVGGQGYIEKVDLGSLSVVATIPVNGSVTSLAVSQQQGEIIYTVVSGSVVVPSGQVADTQSSSFSVQETRLSDGALMATYATVSAPGYSSGSASGSLPATFLMGQGAITATNYGGGAAIAGTPTGFVLISLVSHSQILQGSTSSSVRGIGTNPGQGIVYLTSPDSNSLTTVPLPPAN